MLVCIHDMCRDDGHGCGGQAGQDRSVFACGAAAVCGGVGSELARETGQGTDSAAVLCWSPANYMYEYMDVGN